MHCASPRRREMMFNSVKAVKHHMYVEQQTAEAAYVRVHVPDHTASTKKKNTFQVEMLRSPTWQPSRPSKRSKRMMHENTEDKSNKTPVTDAKSKHANKTSM